MDKVKVSREVAEAFEKLKQKRYYLTPNEILMEHVESYQSKDWFGELAPLNDVDPLTLAHMFDGYKIEDSPQELLVKYVKENEQLMKKHPAFIVREKAKARLEGVTTVLALFNIKVTGIELKMGAR